MVGSGSDLEKCLPLSMAIYGSDWTERWPFIKSNAALGDLTRLTQRPRELSQPLIPIPGGLASEIHVGRARDVHLKLSCAPPSGRTKCSPCSRSRIRENSGGTELS